MTKIKFTRTIELKGKTEEEREKEKKEKIASIKKEIVEAVIPSSKKGK